MNFLFFLYLSHVSPAFPGSVIPVIFELVAFSKHEKDRDRKRDIES